MRLDFSARKVDHFLGRCSAVKWPASYFCLVLEASVVYRVVKVETRVARPYWDLGLSLFNVWGSMACLHPGSVDEDLGPVFINI